MRRLPGWVVWHALPVRIALAGTALDLPGVEDSAAHYNYAIGCLEAYLERHAPDVRVAQHQLRIAPGQTALAAGTADAILASDPEVVGLSSYCWDFDALSAVASDIRARAPSVKIVVGGPAATYDPQAVLRDVPALDVAVIGEGEQTLLRLLRQLDDPSQVPGIAWRDAGTVRLTPSPESPLPMAELPSPYLAGVLNPPRDHVAFESSRGCARQCSHCAWRAFAGGLRYAEPERVADDLRWAVEHGHRYAMFLDSALNFETERLVALADAVGKAVRFDQLRFMYFLDQAHVDATQLRALEKMSSHQIFVGFESSNRAALRALRRPATNPARFAQTLDDLSTIGRVHVTMMLGIPSDTLDGFRKSFDYIASLVDGPRGRRISAIRLFWTVVPRGSEMAREPTFKPRTAERGIPYLLESSTFSRADMVEAIRFVAGHPARDLVAWNDAPPSLHFPELADIDFGGLVGPRSDDRAPPPGLSIEALEALSPSCRAGSVLAGGWKVARHRIHDGWPHVVLERDADVLEIRVEGYRDGERYFVRAGPFALSWRTEHGRREGKLDDSAIGTIRAIAAELTPRS